MRVRRPRPSVPVARGPGRTAATPPPPPPSGAVPRARPALRGRLLDAPPRPGGYVQSFAQQTPPPCARARTPQGRRPGPALWKRESARSALGESDTEQPAAEIPAAFRSPGYDDSNITTTAAKQQSNNNMALISTLGRSYTVKRGLLASFLPSRKLELGKVRRVPGSQRS